MTAFDTDIHVPLVVTGPSLLAGRTLNQIVENIDLCPTFAELAGAAIPASADGRSLVPLLRGKQVHEWRTVALVEHHGPSLEHHGPNHAENEEEDPDAPAVRSGDPPSYEAIRTRSSLYVEYGDGTREYHDRVSDPDELQNTFSSLAPAANASFHAAVAALQRCHGARACWEAARPVPVSMRR